MVLVKEQIKQWKRIENLAIDTHKYSQLIFDKGAKAIQYGKDSLFNKWSRNNWASTCKKKKNLEIDLTLSTKLTQNG